MSTFGKRNLALARDYLASNPEFRLKSTKGAYDISAGQATRLANAFTAQEEAGLPYNYKAARGHLSTPEHPGRKTPLAPPEVAQAYKKASQAKEARLTEEASSAPSQRVTEALLPEERPLHHKRPPYQGHIPYADHGEIYTVPTEREAQSTLHYVSGLEPVGRARITMQVYDCTRERWFPVLSHSWKSGGIAIDDFYELWDRQQSLESWLMSQINSGSAKDSDRPPGGITHICLYEITILPQKRMTG